MKLFEWKFYKILDTAALKNALTPVHGSKCAIIITTS